MNATIKPAQWQLILANTDRECLRTVAEMLALDFANVARGGTPIWTLADLPKPRCSASPRRRD